MRAADGWRRRRAAARTQLAGDASAKAASAAEHATDDSVQPLAGRIEPLSDLTAAAFFDVDNTLIEGASLFHFARGLAARKFFRTSDIVRFAARQVKYRLLGSENMADAFDARTAALAFVAGRPVDQVVALGDEIFDELMAGKIYAGTRRLTESHLAAGQRVYLVTATPIELAQIVARKLGLTGALGTVAEVAGGRYTGRLVGEPLHGPAKAAAVRSLAAREGLTLTRCTAYSDSINDLPMLTTVGTAVAVNPDAALRRWAGRRGWAIHDFRTARKAARIGVPSVLGAGIAGGAVAAGMAIRRRGR